MFPHPPYWISPAFVKKDELKMIDRRVTPPDYARLCVIPSATCSMQTHEYFNGFNTNDFV